MTTYTVEITETLKRQIDVEASSKDEALRQVREKYKVLEIILDADDFADMNMEVYEKEMSNIDLLRKEYPVGTKLECIHMTDPFHPIAPGTKGVVKHIDDMGTIHMSWENGSSLALVPGEDSFKKVKEPQKKKQKEMER